MAVQEKRVAAIESGAATIGIAIGGCLNGFTIRAIGCVETLFTEDDAPPLAFEKEFLSGEVVR